MNTGLFVLLGIVILLLFAFLSRRTSSATGGREDDPVFIMEQIRPSSRPLVEWLCDRASEETGVMLKTDAAALKRLIQAAEQALYELEMKEETEIKLPFLTADSRGPKHFTLMLNRTTCRELGVMH